MGATMEDAALKPASKENGYKTCKITLVNPGLSDSVIKVYPAEHENEKIWLDNAPGIERWESVQRFLYQYALRGTAVPKPVFYHKSVENLITPDIKEEDIPTVQLEGAVLKAPPVVKMPESQTPIPLAHADPATAKRVGDLETELSQVKNSLSEIKGILIGLSSRQNPDKYNPPGVLKAAADAPQEKQGYFPCKSCGSTFKTNQAMLMHAGRRHKQGAK